MKHNNLNKNSNFKYSFRNASIRSRKNRNLKTKRIHRFSDNTGYWKRYGHAGYPMLRILKAHRLTLNFQMLQSHCD